MILAPTYPPAAVFQQPAIAFRALNVRNFSTAELMQMPDAWAVVVKHLPSIKFMTGAAQAKPMLGTMTVADFASFGGGGGSDVLAAIDGDLARLPARDGGKP